MTTGKNRPRRAVGTIAAVAALLLLAATASEDPGRRRLSAALEPLGGVERLSAVDDWVVEGSGRENLSADLQGLSPGEPTWRTHEEKVAVRRASGTVAWERRTPRNDLSVRWRRFLYEPDRFGVVDWTAGFGSMRARSNPAAAREALMRRLPHLLLLEAALRAEQVKAVGERSLGGVPQEVLEVLVPGEPLLTLYLSRAPVSLTRVEYPVYVPGLGDVLVGWTWRGWKKDPRLGLAPSGHRIDVAGTAFQEVEYSRYEAGSPEAASLLSIPASLTPGKEAPALPPAGPSTGEVAPGVRVVEIPGFLGMFVEFRDFVAVFDAPAPAIGLESIPASSRSGTDRPTEALRAAIAAASPGKPVRYLIVSHHHGDHLGGVRGFAGRGVTVLAAPAHVQAVRRALDAPHSLSGDSWAGSPRETMIEAVPDRRRITDGSRTLEVVNVGENPHSTQNLFAWLPAERLLLQGDLFYYAEGEPFPPSGREAMNRFFSRWLAANGFAPKAVYGVHAAGAAGPEALASAAR